MIHRLLSMQRKSGKVAMGILAAVGLISGCGGGGGGGSKSANPAVNQKPVVSITSPSGTYFKEGENIAFTASASDAEDGQLAGSSLVWTSSKDGQLGTGATLITSALSTGDQDITLTATDSQGAAATATLPTINIAHTRFIKMGSQTAGVPDASNAFDADLDTPATIMTSDTEFIHYKAYLGIADTFFFKIKIGASTPGSRLAVQALTTVGAWQPVSDIALDADKTVLVKVTNAQSYVDVDSYINLRARWEGGASGDIASIFEIWRVDPAFNDSRTTGVSNEELAFDDDLSTFAAITSPWVFGSNEVFLSFKVYVGSDIYDAFSQPEPFKLKIFFNNIGSFNSLFIDAEDLTAQTLDSWVTLQELKLDTTSGIISIQNVNNYLDADGYISLRARWVSGSTVQGNVNIYEISRFDPIYVGPKTVLDWKPETQNAVDGDLNTYAVIFYYWGEAGHNDFLHVQSYAGDSPITEFSVKWAPSVPGSGLELIVDGALGQDEWQEIERINMDNPGTKTFTLNGLHQYCDSRGILNLRFRWLNGSPQTDYDAFIYEIWNEAQ